MDDLTATVRGVTIGCDTVYPFAPEFPSGVLDTPEIRTADTPFARRNGVIPGSDFYGGKALGFVVRLTGTLTAVEQSISTLGAAFAAGDSDEVLAVRFTGMPSEYAFFGRCRGITTAWRTRALPTVSADVRCSFLATDPIRYGTEMVEVVDLASHPLPQTLPFVLGFYDSETVNNAGNTSVDRWTVEMEAVGGSLSDPSIAHVGSGQLIFHDLLMSSGETLLVDGQERRALLNGVTPVIPTVAQWWTLPPGDSEIRFAAGVSSSLSSTATVTWRPGWT